MLLHSKFRAWVMSGCAAITAATFSASARGEILFDSLDSPTTEVNENPYLAFIDATFMTGASTFHATDIALLLNQVFFISPDDTFTVSLRGGVPLEDVMFDPGLGLNVFPKSEPVLGSVTLPISDLSTSLSVQNFGQFADIALQPNTLYWIDLSLSGGSNEDGTSVGWATTSDMSGIGVAENYNSSYNTDNQFFLNQGVPPFAFDVAFQMKVSGTAAPEPSTWALMLVGLGGLGVLAHRRSVVALRRA